MRVLLINKDIARTATGRLVLAGVAGRSGTVQHMHTERIFATGLRRSTAELARHALPAAAGFSSVSLELPAASLTLVTLDL